jgi:hypothetical protein
MPQWAAPHTGGGEGIVLVVVVVTAAVLGGGGNVVAGGGACSLARQAARTAGRISTPRARRERVLTTHMILLTRLGDNIGHDRRRSS